MLFQYTDMYNNSFNQQCGFTTGSAVYIVRTLQGLNISKNGLLKLIKFRLRQPTFVQDVNTFP